jgi:ABC-type multidrug transport system permease subunit
MKVFHITAKNLKLLMRSKTSMFVIIFGPLIIMLLVGFAFNNPTASKLNIGYVPKEKTNLTMEFLGALKANPSFSLIEYNDSTYCRTQIEQGNAHICIVFPDDFDIQNNKTNEIIFYVDQSRANFVYAIIDTVSSKIDLTSSQLSYQMTADLLSVISYTQKSNSDQIIKLIALKNSADDISAKLKDVQTKLSSLDLSQVSVNTEDMSSFTGNINNDVEGIKTQGTAVVSLGNQFASDIKSLATTFNNNQSAARSQFLTDLSSGQGSIGNATTQAESDIDLLNQVIDTVTADVTTLNNKLDTAKVATADSNTQITAVQASLSSLKADLDFLKSSIEKTNSQISSIKVTSAESIVNPIKTTVTPITSKGTNLNFVFPYLIILIIAFISLMLSSTIIMIEKTSKAYFRNFTTPTKDFTFIISVFLTSFFVVILQLIFILILAYYFLHSTILSNVGLTLLLVVLSITLFTLIGMLIGYLFNSQEAATMASISVGSVFLFLSNLILPLESMSPVIQEASRYNPYVVASELLKKLTLFGSPWSAVYLEFALIAAYIIGVFILVIVVEKMSKIQYISKRPVIKQLRKDDIIDKYFKLRSGVLIRDEKELLEELKRMSDITFQDYVTAKKNDFESWLILNNKNELAKRVGKSRTRKELIESLEKFESEIPDPLKSKK